MNGQNQMISAPQSTKLGLGECPTSIFMLYALHSICFNIDKVNIIVKDYGFY